MNDRQIGYFTRLQQLMFAVAAVLTCWLGMMAVHELGHMIGAILTGGRITCVVLHPLSISRTDVHPNPNPIVVVWSGPVLGCLIPIMLLLVTKSAGLFLRSLAKFFAGACLIANGAYLLFGSIDQVGDCKQMLQTGSPQWLLIAFGVITIPVGFALWHKTGSIENYWRCLLYTSPSPRDRG